jgi:hypothetical protein
MPLRRNFGVTAGPSSLGFRLFFKRGIQVSRVWRFVASILEEILLFLVAHIAPHERIRVPSVGGYLRSRIEQ